MKSSNNDISICEAYLSNFIFIDLKKKTTIIVKFDELYSQFSPHTLDNLFQNQIADNPKKEAINNYNQ